MSDHRDGIITDMQKRAQEKGWEIASLHSQLHNKEDRIVELQEHIEGLKHEIALRDRAERLLTEEYSKATLGHHLKAWWRGRW